MKASSIFKMLGTLFAVIGVTIGLAVIIGGEAFGAEEVIPLGIFFLVMFGGLGGFFAIYGFRMTAEEDRILRDGSVWLGKIFGYTEDRSIIINGAPAVALVVRYMRKGEIRETVVNTGDSDRSKYPVGATVSISLLDGKAALVPGSVTAAVIEREKDLMDPDLDPNARVSSVTVTCPSCGALVVVPLGMSRFCPYCDRKLRAGEDEEAPAIRREEEGMPAERAEEEEMPADYGEAEEMPEEYGEAEEMPAEYGKDEIIPAEGAEDEETPE